MVWPMDDKADPLNGWPIWEVRHTQSPVMGDLYGKLFIYLRVRFKVFLKRLATTRIDFEMRNVDARDLRQYLESDKYARIEVCTSTGDGVHDFEAKIVLRLPISPTPATLESAKHLLCCLHYFSHRGEIHTPRLLPYSLTQSWKL